MRTLYTIAYPVVSAEARRFIDRVRAAHDPQHGIVGAHFTLLFGSATLQESVYTEHVREIARQASPIRLACRSAVTGADAVTPAVHVYLMPDEGCDAILQLHDRLYRGPMAAQRRTEIPYLPHITVAAKADLRAAQALCDELDAAGVDVVGRIDRLTVGMLQDGRFVDLSHHALAAA